MGSRFRVRAAWAEKRLWTRPNEAASGGGDYYVIEDERCSTNEDECGSEERNESDVTEK